MIYLFLHIPLHLCYILYIFHTLILICLFLPFQDPYIRYEVKCIIYYKFLMWPKRVTYTNISRTFQFEQQLKTFNQYWHIASSVKPQSSQRHITALVKHLADQINMCLKNITVYKNHEILVMRATHKHTTQPLD